MYTAICKYIDGVHVSGPPNCPHILGVDEEGVHLPAGWTVQSEEITTKIKSLKAKLESWEDNGNYRQR